MKLIYKGKYDGNQESLPHKEHKPGAVKFREIEDPKKFAAFINVVAFIITVLLVALFFLRSWSSRFSILGALCSLLVLFPHEILHAICFKKEVYLYTNWKNGMLFVVGPEDMSKGRFIFMSLLPNLVFGMIPYILYLIFPEYIFLGSLGMIAIGEGAGDYYNVFNALTQMPKGARTYLYGFHSYWYMPEGKTADRKGKA